MRQFFTLIKSDILKQLGQIPRSGTKETNSDNLKLIFITLFSPRILIHISIILDAVDVVLGLLHYCTEAHVAIPAI